MSMASFLSPALRVAGFSLVILSLLHLTFPRRFRWREEFAAVSLLNREIFYVHTFFVCLVVAGMGLVCVIDPGSLLIRTRLGQWVAAGGTVFWAARLYIQFFVYSASHWRGRRFECRVHIGFALLWTFYTAVFAACFAHQRQWLP